MNILFSGCESPTLGAEIEVQLVDGSGALVTDTAATKILAELEGFSGYKHELLECCVEVISDVHNDVAGVRKDLQDKIDGYDAIPTKPRETRASVKTITQQLDESFDEGD